MLKTIVSKIWMYISIAFICAFELRSIILCSFMYICTCESMNKSVLPSAIG